MKRFIKERLTHTKPAEDPAAEALARLSGDVVGKFALGNQEIKPAAVLVPLVERHDGLTILLTKRTEHLPDHPGQISFPGGRIEPHDGGAVAAALRETAEETGLAADYVEVAGFLRPYLTITGYVVTPVVGFVEPGFTLQPDDFEVAEVFEVPLDFVLDPGNHVIESREFRGRPVEYFVIQYQRHRIWGATAAMLVGFYETLSVDGPQGSSANV
ncbi:MAG: CoA pyrophosphatase [Gammaproteobacteria bacterium]|nr:CoA pyrophosphatase [Gammaproteobacteria bacterium]